MLNRPGIELLSDPADSTEPAPQPDETVRCSACGHPITRRSKAMEVNGAHEHTFRNPAGYSFHVVCYSEAPGSLRAGEPTSLASWFPGYEWCYALCGECHTHLGWWFESRDEASFAGLIATRLVRPPH